LSRRSSLTYRRLFRGLFSSIGVHRARLLTGIISNENM
jgi:hypothetical protein